MIGHETVRKNSKPPVGGGVSNLHKDGVHDLRVGKDTKARVRTDRQRISVRAPVIESADARGAVWHMPTRATNMRGAVPGGLKASDYRDPGT